MSYDHTGSTYPRHTTNNNAQIAWLQHCRLHAVRVRHNHVRSDIVVGCVCRSIQLHLPYFYHTRVPWLTYIPVNCCVLSHGTRTTTQTTIIATAHTACLLTSINSFLQNHNASTQQQRSAQLARIDDCPALIAVCDTTLPPLHLCSSQGAPTDAAGRVLCPCGRYALYAQYCCSMRCCC